MRKSSMTQKFVQNICIALFLLIISNAAMAQAQYNTTNWRFSNPKQFGFTVFDVDFFDNNNVIAVGSDGGIAKSSNGGTNWTYGPLTFVNPSGQRVKPSFLDVHYVSANTAYAVGSLGCMAKTTDGGANWSFVNTPLAAGSKNINACWFLDENRGYIGGEFNTLDSIPKVYFTLNGGTTWDSLASPVPTGKTVVGYINNPNLPPLQWDLSNKGKQIYRIEFLNENLGYVTGSASGLYPRFPSAVAATCLPTGTTTTTGSSDAPLVWKFKNGSLADYSPTKERLGYTGINTSTITCTTTYGSITPQSQQYRALGLINDTTIVIMSFNNNTVIKIKTGVNDSTLNVNVPGLYEKGKYEMLNFPYPPNGATPIPATQVLLASNPYKMVKAASGKLYAPANFANVWTSVDTGRNWIQEKSLPQNQNYSNLATWALDISPSGKFLSMGTYGVTADSIAGGNWTSTYKSVPFSATHTESRFTDCNNGILAGGSSITVTEDGGATWQDKNRPDFAASYYSINGMAYPNTGKAYFGVSNGVIYTSPDKGTTLDPAYTNINFQMNGVDAIGNDTVWVAGYSQYTVAAASRTTNIFRSFDGGATWTAIGGFPLGTTGPNLSRISFGSRNVGYVAGTRNGVYKTTDGGTTWTSINPFPSLNEAPTGYPSAYISYTEVQALDENTVFVVGNMFTSTGVKRVYKSTDGGANWTDITSNLSTLLPVGNLIGLNMSDANNGYVTAGSALFKTTDGGTTWTMDLAPTSTLFETMAFAPNKVPAGIPFANRKLFVTGFTALSGSGTIMEYGNPDDVNVNATETITNTNCTNPNGGAIVLNTTGGLAPYSYSINSGAFQSSNSFTGLAQGTYTINIKDAFCGTFTKTVTIGFTDNLTVTAAPADTAVCAGAPVQLRATSNGSATYAWSPAGGLSSTTIANPVATNSSNTTYTVTATLNGCVKTATATITIKANPVVNAGPDKTILIGSTAQLQGSAAGTTVSVLWNPAATLTNANTFTPLAQPNTTTTYTMTVVNGDGCTSTDDATVTVIPYCVKPANAFTPNGDGINDRWVVTDGNACTNQVMVKVFNRYGNVVFEDNNYQNDWDGKYKGKPVPDGTYYYVIQYRLISGKVVPMKGDVTILR
ncbi:MAG: gliding motility-associated C-terminal domain-containing protein [Ferruginibacter sp.]